jgi:hypothetical protein
MKLWEVLQNGLETFGFNIKTSKPAKSENLAAVDLERVDGSTGIIANQGGIIGYSEDLTRLPTGEVELIKTYRDIAVTSDVDWALNEIRNEIFIFDVPEKKAIELSFSDSEENMLSRTMMDTIRDEYNYLYDLLDFHRKGLDLFDRWYIDGRLFLQKVVNTKNLRSGIQRVTRIDPLKIKKIVEYPEADANGIYDLSKIKTYFIFSDIYDVQQYIPGQSTNTIKIISNDAITYVDSGIYDFNTGIALSYLWKMIVPYNNMKTMEEALLINRVVRSPERRVFYVGVGGLSKAKAEQYMQDLMSRFRNKLVYDTKSGTIVDRKNVLSMVEDYWLPRREGSGTEISTLQGAQNLGEIDDVNLFRKRFQQSTNVPLSRFREEPTSFTFGKTTDIDRDEYRFKKFLDKLRNRFVGIFEDLLKTQLLLKKIIVESDWDNIRQSIVWMYTEDNNFVLWKESEVLQSQIEILGSMDEYVGKYFGKKWALKRAMNLSDEDVDDMIQDAEADSESSDDNQFSENIDSAEEAHNMQLDNSGTV